MSNGSRRVVREGAVYGVAAGVVFAVMEIVVTAAIGGPPLMPVRMFASIVLGAGALEGGGALAILVGLLVHLVLSAVYGTVYGLWNAGLFPDTRTSWGRQVGLGLAFGGAVYFLNFQVFSRMLFPWFLEAAQLLQLVLHMLFFGLPLGLLLAGAERRAQGTAPAGDARSQTA